MAILTTATAAAAALFPTADGNGMERPLQSTETEISYILPEDCLIPDFCDTHAVTADGTLWKFDSKPEKVAELSEGDAVKVSQTSTRGLMMQKEKKLTLSVQKRGESEGEPQPLAALTGITAATVYALVGDNVYIGLPIGVLDGEGQQQLIPSICSTWEQGEAILAAENNDGEGMLVNVDKRQAGDVYSLGTVRPKTITALDELEYTLDDQLWTVFPNFFAVTEDWDEGEQVHAMADDLEDWFGPVEELDEEFKEAILEFFGDPGWSSWEHKRIMLGINGEHNAMGVFWQEG